jgi:proline dehydrogenase
VLRDALIYLSGNRLARSVATHAPGARTMARRFVAGETVDDGIAAARTLNRQGAKVSLDYLGESVRGRDEATAAANMYMRLIERIATEKLDANVSMKLTQMGQDIDTGFLHENVKRVLDLARGHDMFMRFDMESSRYTQRTLDFFRQLWEEGYRNIGVVLQSYLYRSEKDVTEMNALGARVRLCKGAYQESADVAFPEKRQVDANFLKLMRLLITNGNYPGIATHDEAIIRATIACVQETKTDPSKFEFQMLYGVRRDLQHELRSQGYNLRVYVPYGEAWYPYLMRRMAERPANLLFIVNAVLAESPLAFLVRKNERQ